MRTCRYCGIEQPEENFEIANTINGQAYRRHKCKACKQRRQRERRRELRIWLCEYKKTLRCSRCGISDYRVIEFHHIEAGAKRFAVGDILRKGGSLSLLKSELEKCSVLCANCHRIEHFDTS